jgi:hypothetical protein
VEPDGTTTVLFDGAPGQTKTGGLPEVAAAGFAIGANTYTGGGSNWDGEFIAAAIWDRALTDEEIAQATEELLR